MASPPRRLALTDLAMLCPLLVGAGALIVYLATLAPGLTWANNGADGGDLITAAVTGGVAHPPGYPTYLLLAPAPLAPPFRSLALPPNPLSPSCAAAASARVTCFASPSSAA